MGASLIQFEDDYIFRNNRTITANNDIALTEFVANAWDAGAHNVYITIPEEDDDQIVVEDDGTGMTDEEFRSRWMTLNYDRQKRQGRDVAFPPDVEQYKRIAYGRNGIGRHGMLCFADSYTVETWKDGKCNQYSIALSSGEAPFKIAFHRQTDRDGHGTRISAYVKRHRPNADAMTEIISARFLYDPRFIVQINGHSVDLLEHKGVILNKEIEPAPNVKMQMIAIDSSKTAAKSQQHGIAFWVSGRLVGKPSWTYGDTAYLDGRLKAAKRYTIILKTDDLIDDVLPDWTGFSDTPQMVAIYQAIKREFDAFIRAVMADQIEDMRLEVIRDVRDELESLSIGGQRDLSVFIETVTGNNPIVSPDFLKSAVDAMVAIEKAKNGETLLRQISQMDASQIDKLAELLSTWDVNDITAVMTEIDKRILVVEAINRLYNEKDTDELHTLHPLVLSARWLFGAQFDSPMFVSNSALTTVVRKLFSDNEFDLDAIANPRKRPDIVCLNTFTMSAVCTDRIDVDSGGVMKPDQILIIEVKRGGFEINADEVAQVEHYVRQIRKSAVLHSDATITAFVVGASLGDIDTDKQTSSGQIHAVTYGHLVDTASGKLFRLRDRLKAHYDTLGQESIVEKALKEAKQLTLGM